jgi:Protein of unknown function (DUF1615)
MTGRQKIRRVIAGWVVTAAFISGCVGERRMTAPPDALNPTDARTLIDKSMPRPVADRQGWVADIYAGLSVLDIPATPSNICAVIAVIAQESSFRVDPIVANLPAIAWRTIDERAAAMGIPRLLVHGVLKVDSPNGRSYAERIDDARTEKQLSDIFQDFIGTVPMGRTLFAEHNPIRTRGPMQVQVTFAEQFAAAKPYPYPVKTTLADEVFTRRGGVYFGIAHLLAYPADYDRYLYRFADFNAGQYASRDAAFQGAVSAVSGIALIPDGSLLARDGDAKTPGATELAVRAVGTRLNLSSGSIHSALEKGRNPEFAQSALYERMFSLADRAAGRALPRARVPQIDLHGPKISRKLTTAWYAERVNERFERCLAQ